MMKFSQEIQDKIMELDELHTLIKNNKFRENMQINYKYGPGYFDLLYKFSDKFNEIRKLDSVGQLSKLNSFLFIHDFNSDINICRASIMWIIRYENNDPFARTQLSEEDIQDDWAIIIKRTEDLERAIGCIHSFIETSYFDTFYAWERGVYMKYEWNSENFTYEPVKILKEYKPGNKDFVLANNIFPTLKSEDDYGQDYNL